jgi:molybdate transport system substrate-binding protein
MSTVTLYRSALVIISVLGLACHDAHRDATSDCSDRIIRMGVASSLREVALSLRQEFLTRNEPIAVEMVFGASSALARQLVLGAPMDVFVSADAEIVDDLVRRGLLTADSTLEFARGRLSLVANAKWLSDNPGVDVLDSLHLKRIAIPSAAVPLGRYARFWLKKTGRLDQLQGKIVVTEHARATLSAVDAGHVDAAIVYASDARLAHSAIALAQIEPSEYPPIRYVAARVAATTICPSIDAAIDEALAAWTSPATSERLASIGFLPIDSTEPL